jgi:PAS domain-containing protein
MLWESLTLEELRAAARKGAGSLALLRSYLEQIATPSVAKDKIGRILWANRAMHRQFNLTPGCEFGITLADCLAIKAPADRKRLVLLPSYTSATIVFHVIKTPPMRLSILTFPFQAEDEVDCLLASMIVANRD